MRRRRAARPTQPLPDFTWTPVPGGSELAQAYSLYSALCDYMDSLPPGQRVDYASVVGTVHEAYREIVRSSA